MPTRMIFAAMRWLRSCIRHSQHMRMRHSVTSTSSVSVSGRMMAKRVMGKASFVKIQDRSGQIQLRLERDRLPEGVYQDFKKWDVGDIVGAAVSCSAPRQVN